MIKKTLFFWLIMSIGGCSNGYKRTGIKMDGRYVDEAEIHQTVKGLLSSKKSEQAIKLLDTLILNNRGNGYLYYEKGFVKGHDFQCESSIDDLKIAQKLNYKKKNCQYLIDACRIIIHYNVKRL